MAFNKKEDNASGVVIKKDNSLNNNTGSSVDMGDAMSDILNGGILNTGVNDSFTDELGAEETNTEQQPEVDHNLEAMKSAKPRKRNGPSSLGNKSATKATESSAESEASRSPVNKKILFGGCLVAVILVLVSMVVFSEPKDVIVPSSGPVNSNAEMLEETPLVENVIEPTGEELLQQQLAEEGFGVGNSVNNTDQNTTPLVSNTFLKDLTGIDVPEYYTVKEITYITDLVPYTKHRAVTGEGIELYWMEGTYRGQPCKFTIPYKYYRELDTSGAIPCMIEIVQTTEGALLATWFQFSEPAYTELKNKS